MGRSDWDRILSVDPASLTDEEIEDLYPTIINCNVDEINNVPNLHILMKVSQEMLQYKDNQVESLLLECGELKEIISSLRNQVSTQKERDKPEVETGVTVIKKSIQENETLASRDTISGKSEKIETLIDELESLDKENVILKERLVALKEEMEDATEKMDEMTKELSIYQIKNTQYKEKISEIEQENVALVSQIEEITNQQTRRDKIIDEFGTAIETRVSEWKLILDEKDAEITRLKENLSQTVVHSTIPIARQDVSQIECLNEDIAQRDKIIVELQQRLSEAIVEINEGATLIEKLKADAKKMEKGEKRKGHKDLIQKLQEANDKIFTLQNLLSQSETDVKSKSSKLCEALATLKRYEDKDYGLTEALNEIKLLKTELNKKNIYIEDLVNVINKLETLNSYQDMEIVTLREKLSMPEDEIISIKDTIMKSNKERKKVDDLIQQNKVLIEENLKLKSDVRVLQYKKDKMSSAINVNNINGVSSEFLHSTKLVDPAYDTSKIETESLYEGADINDEKLTSLQIVIEENDALRRGMHEILDSINEQDGKSAVEIQSNTLERLLEALDSRHLAGWYHPAMRFQEHLNVIRGKNAELRTLVKKLREELSRKDYILQEFAQNKNIDIDKLYCTKSEEELYLSKIKQLEIAYQNEIAEWNQEKEILIKENKDLKDTVENIQAKLQVLEENWQILELSENEIERNFAIKIKECAKLSADIYDITKKYEIIRNLLDNETARAYEHQKEALTKESNLKMILADAKECIKLLESEVQTLQNNLSNTVMIVEHEDLREKYKYLNIQYHALLEKSMVTKSCGEIEVLKAEIDLLREEKKDILEEFQNKQMNDIEDSLAQQLVELRAKEISERQRADRAVKLYEISQSQLEKYESNFREYNTINSELQEKLYEFQKELTKREKSVEASLDENKHKEVDSAIVSLKIANENLESKLQIAQEEAQMQFTVNSLKTLELDHLRHQILDLQAASEDKATISRLDFELSQRKSSEIELHTRKSQLENEVLRLQEELEKAKIQITEMRAYAQNYRVECDSRCSDYREIIDFLQSQYAGCTSISALDRILSMSTKIQNDRNELDLELNKAKERHNNAILQQDLLASRLEIVGRLKDILEQQIGSNDMQNIMQQFSEYSQRTFNEFKYKRQIINLEYELQVANNRLSEYTSTIKNMEHEMMIIQRIWCLEKGKVGISENLQIPHLSENKSVAIQVEPLIDSAETQTDFCPGYKKSEDTDETTTSKLLAPDITELTTIKKSVKHVGTNTKDYENIIKSNEKLSETLKFESDQSILSEDFVKFETQVVEYQAKINTLNAIIDNKDSLLADKDKIIEDYKSQISIATPDYDCGDRLALKSTINSLQKIINQKEETILRYQSLLKEDRDEYIKTIAELQEEIKNLQHQISTMQEDIRRKREKHNISQPEKLKEKAEESIVKDDLKPDVNYEDKVARLNEKVSTLEADLNIMKELSDRWRKLAEERLQHMDSMRDRLEEQHKSELDSYCKELNKWQLETDTLRKQLSECRTLLTKGNISMLKDIQERDDKIHELGLTCQQLQSEIELLEHSNQSQMVVHNPFDSKAYDVVHTASRDHMQQQSHLDSVRRQLQSLMEKEKMYKHEIADLKQQLSRRYMAIKTQEKKTSQREMQLERKIKMLEDELDKMRLQIDRDHLIQEVKRAKTAEELALWEKQKKWQQTAEKLKEKLKEKTEEYNKLNVAHEKLRSIISCQEREKTYLKSKLKLENLSTGSISARAPSVVQDNIAEDLQRECQILKERIKELSERLDKEDNSQLYNTIEEQRRRIIALETVAQGNVYMVNQIEQLEARKDYLEKTNLKLESENFELRLEVEKANLDTPALREKVEHLKKYIDLLKIEKSSDSTPRSFDKNIENRGSKKSVSELEKTIFTLKKIIERLQTENKRLKFHAKPHTRFMKEEKKSCDNYDQILLQKQYEQCQKRVVDLETDLQLAEQRIVMLENLQKEEDDKTEMSMLKQQLNQKSSLLERVKQLLTKAAINEKSLREKIQQLENRSTLSTIPECYITPSTPE